MNSYKQVNNTLNEPLAKTEIMKVKLAESFKFIFFDREYFKTLIFDYDDVSDWLKQTAAERMIGMGLS